MKWGNDLFDIRAISLDSKFLCASGILLSAGASGGE
jgi:hypothetical protein